MNVLLTALSHRQKKGSKGRQNQEGKGFKAHGFGRWQRYSARSSCGLGVPGRGEAGQATIDYQSYVVKRNLEDYWRAEDKVELVLNGMHGKIPVTTLCKLNNVSPSLYYEWREKFLASGKEGMMANGGRSQREGDLEKKVRVLERLIGELTLERELLKKINAD